MRVLITRPQPDAEIFAELCRAHQLEPIVCPLMEIETTEVDIDLSAVSALAFTSANGVRAFARVNPERHLPVFTVGDASASIAKGLGFGNVRAAGGDVDALAKMIVCHLPKRDRAVLHVAGNRRAGDLVSVLQEAGLKARRQVLYRVRDVSALTQDVVTALPSIDWLVLFSPRSAQLFLTLTIQAGLVEALAQVRVACLSEAVAVKIAAVGWKTVEIAAGRNVASMIELVARA